MHFWCENVKIFPYFTQHKLLHGVICYDLAYMNSEDETHFSHVILIDNYCKQSLFTYIVLEIENKFFRIADKFWLSNGILN